MKLGLNVDHVATIRQARLIDSPDPVAAAVCAQYAADSIVIHLREDRRHIQDRDLFVMKQAISIPLNLEMSINKGIVSAAIEAKPKQVTLVPEKRQELTTEGGINLVANFKKISKAIDKLQSAGIEVSVFIDPVKRQIDKAKQLNVKIIEINTGRYSESKTLLQKKKNIEKIKLAAIYAKKKGLFIAAGHGLDYENVFDIVKIKEIEELNIGHSIIARSLFVGLSLAVEEMKQLITRKK